MENLSWLEKIIGLVALLLPSLVTLWLGRIQAQNQAKKDEIQARLEVEKEKSDGLLNFSNAARNIGESWEEIVANLRAEIARIKADALEKEQNFLSQLKVLREQLQDSQSRLDSVMETDMRRTKELRDKLSAVTSENDQLRIQIVKVEGENLRIQTEQQTTMIEVQQLRVENDQLREAMRRINVKVDGIQKKVTGELNLKKDG